MDNAGTLWLPANHAAALTALVETRVATLETEDGTPTGITIKPAALNTEISNAAKV